MERVYDDRLSWYNVFVQYEDEKSLIAFIDTIDDPINHFLLLHSGSDRGNILAYIIIVPKFFHLVSYLMQRFGEDILTKPCYLMSVGDDEEDLVEYDVIDWAVVRAKANPDNAEILFDAVPTYELSNDLILPTHCAVVNAQRERQRATRAFFWVMTTEPSRVWRDLAPEIASRLLWCSVAYWKNKI